MTPSSNGYPYIPTPEYIDELTQEVKRNPTDLVQKILLANALEQTGEITKAINLYQEIIALDRDGEYSSTAQKALKNLINQDVSPKVTTNTNSFGVTSTITRQRQQPKFLAATLRGWKNLNFRTKLTVLLVASTAIPVIVVTQGVVAVTRQSLFNKFQQTLQAEGTSFVKDYVLWNVDESRNEADTIARFVQTAQIDLSNPQQIEVWRSLLQNFINNFQVSASSTSIEKNIRIVTDAQGRTVAQHIQTLAEDSFNSPPDQLQLQPHYREISLPLGIYLGDIPIVQNALKTGKELGGIELWKSDVLKRLGQDKQANIGVKSQITAGLPASVAPFAPGIYDIDGGKAALVSMVVKPIKIGNKTVGTVIIGSIKNRNGLIVDSFKSRLNVPVATIFAQDWRVNSNVPTSEGTRDIGTRASRTVAQTVLNQGKELIEQTKIAGVDYLGVYQPLYDHQQELNPNVAKPVGMTFVARPLAEVNGLLTTQQLTAYGIGLAMTFIAGLVAIIIAGSFARPLRRLAEFAAAVGNGKQELRLEDTHRQDEIGVLTRNLNGMAANIEANLQAIKQQSALQRQEKENLQQGMINLLLETETAQNGDLTVRAKVDRGETGALADAFNRVMDSLQTLVVQVKSAVNSVQTEAIDTEERVQKLSASASNSSSVVAQTLLTVAQMEQSIGAIAQSAQTAAQIARTALESAQFGDRTMAQTVDSIEMLGASVNETTTKAKRLAESAQEISQIVSIITEISEKTNVLAFNAAIEASKAGEHGKGFRQVANEVRRLALIVTQSTQEIEQLVSTIQQGTGDVLKTMEVSNTNVVTTTQQVTKTKQTLQSLADISQEIDSVLQSISMNTVSQAEKSKIVNSSMQTAEAIAQTTKIESAAVLSAMQELLEVAQELQNSVSRFRVE